MRLPHATAAILLALHWNFDEQSFEKFLVAVPDRDFCYIRDFGDLALSLALIRQYGGDVCRGRGDSGWSSAAGESHSRCCLENSNRHRLCLARDYQLVTESGSIVPAG